MTQEEYLQKQIELGDRLLTERQRHREVLHALKTKHIERLMSENKAYHEAEIAQKAAYDEAVAGIEAERRKLRADWMAELNAAALQAGVVQPA